MDSPPFKLPPADSLPGQEATLQEIIRFASTVDPTAHFRDQWGAEYTDNVSSLWGRCVQLYKAGAPASGTPEELLMCLTYDCVLGPYLGVPEPHKLSFLRWLIEGIQRGLEGE